MVRWLRGPQPRVRDQLVSCVAGKVPPPPSRAGPAGRALIPVHRTAASGGGGIIIITGGGGGVEQWRR
jgi:hypothetical protein